MGHKTPMRSPNPANSDHNSVAPQPVLEKGATGSGATHAAVDGEVVPRLPHERDESSDSGMGEPTERKRLAACDVADVQVDTQRGSATQRNYSDLTGRAQEQAKTDTEPD